MKKIALLIVVFILLALAPLGVKNIIDEQVQIQTVLLEQKGVKVDVLNSSGYLKTKREFELTIKDEKEFKEFIKASFVKKYPTYEELIDSLLKEDSKELDEFLRGIVFRGNINNSNINYNSDINVNIYLHKFSDKIMKKLNENKDKNQEMLSLLEKKALAFDIVLSKNAVLKKLTLKDIDENIVSTNSIGQTSTTDLKVLSYFVNNYSEKDLLKAKINLDRFLIKTVTSNKESIIDLNSLVYDFTYLDEYINSSKLKLENFIFAVNDIDLAINGIDLKSKGEVKSGLYQTYLDLKTNNVEFSSRKDKLSINSVIFDLKLNDILYNDLKNLNSAYINMELITLDNTLTKNEKSLKLTSAIDNLILSIDEVLNNGATLKTKLDLKDLQQTNVSFKNIDLDIDLVLNKNTLSFQTLDKKELLSNVDGNIVLVLPKDDFINFLRLVDPTIGMLLSVYAKEQKNDILFDLKINKGVITVNDKKLN